MTSLKFERPVGAHADLAELQYVSALHQTADDLRPDGSLRSVDISYLLRSKFGLALTEEEVRDVVLRGLSTGDIPAGRGWKAGGKEEIGPDEDGMGGDYNDEDVFDLCEVVAALLIPELLKAASGGGGDKTIEDEGDCTLDDAGCLSHRETMSPRDILSIVLENIVKTALGPDDQEGAVVNSETVKHILMAFGEEELARNEDLVQDMVKQAMAGASNDAESGGVPLDVKSFALERNEDLVQDMAKQAMAGASNDAESGGVPLDVESFARALASDVQAYDIESDSNKYTTTYTEVFGSKRGKTVLGCGRKQQVATQGEGMPNPTKSVVADEGGSNHNHVGEATIETAVGQDITVGTDVDDDKYQPKRIMALPSIDYFIDAQSSRCIAVSLWMFFLLHILASGNLGLQDFPHLVPSDLEMCPDTPDLGCDTLEVFLSWVDTVFTLTIIGGIFIMGIGSLGNRINGASRLAVVASLAPALYFLIKPFTSIGTAPGDMEGQPHRQLALGLSMAVAVVIILERMRQFAYFFVVPKRWMDVHPKLMTFFARGFTGSEYKRLDAASYKADRLLCNACDIARESKEKEQRQELLFYQKDDAVEKVGGHKWTWKRMRSGSLYNLEGIRFSARLVAANILQFAVIIYIILFMMVTTRHWIENYQNSTVIVLVRSGQEAATKAVGQLEDLSGLASAAIEVTFNSVFPALELLRLKSCETISSDVGNSTFADICFANNTLLSDLEAQSVAFKTLVLASMMQKADPIRTYLVDAIEAGADMLTDMVTVVDPLEPWMIQMAFGIAGLVAFFASIFLATLYLPSIASTTMRYRSGVFQSLSDPKRFSKLHRRGMHSVTYLTGALFWGTLLYVVMVSFVIAFLIIIIIWVVRVIDVIENDQPPPGLWGWVLGSVVAFVVQYALFNMCTCTKNRGFYRRQPGRANIHNLLWEAAWVGLSILFVVMRFLKLIVAAALQIGRIDIPFLAEGVGVYGGFNLDSFPLIFRKDILAHEAHNHPFIERLSKIYLLKVANPEFANAAGTTWRLIFVLALFPWLRKYREDAKLCSKSQALFKVAE